MSGEYLTMAEIEARYPNEWVLIDRPKVDQFNDPLGGYVVWHHVDRGAFDRHLSEHPLADSAITFAGELHPEPFYCVSIWTDDSTPS